MMTTEALRELRDQLHAELTSDAPLDPERRTLLLDVKTDIDGLLAREPVAAELSPADTMRLQSRLQAAAVGFEGSHPQLASLLEQTMNVLSNLGL